MTYTAPGMKALRTVQIGGETTHGSAIAATRVFRVEPVPIEDLREVQPVAEALGYLSGSDETVVPKIAAHFAMSGVATFEQLPYVLAASIDGVVAGTAIAGTGASGYIYTYTMPQTTGGNDIKTYTIESGNNVQGYEMEYSFVESWELSGAQGVPITMTASWVGRQRAKCSLTGSLAVPTVDHILFGKSRLYVDAVSGTAGTTQVSNTLLSFSLKAKPGWKAFYSGDDVYFSHADRTADVDFTLDMVVKYDAATAVALDDARVAETPKLVQLEIDGPALGTAGSLYTTKRLIVTLAGKILNAVTISEQDGIETASITFQAKRNATAAKWFAASIVNELSALP